MENEALEIQEFYNDIAQRFADEWYDNDSLLDTLKHFLSLLPHSPIVLDLGCGAGYESMRLKKLGAQVVGIDYSEAPIQIARDRNPDCRFEVMDFRSISPELGRFDGIVAIASLIHIKDEELARVFNGMKSVLSAGGYVMVILKEGKGLSSEHTHIERDGKKYNRYFYLHGRADLDKIAGCVGFAFFAEWPLSKEQQEFGWKCFVYHSVE